ncbi:MAG: DUF4954 family protein [Bacteroidetes bacterium]|nr:DUF4954 family protein [Bacteroidota bacterium]
MNIITKHPLKNLGYNFISKEYIPKNKDEYYLRNLQNKRTDYRPLTQKEIARLKENMNSADDWSMIKVAPPFNPDLVKNNHFYGLVRIGKLEELYLEFHNLRMPVGIYNSTIISSDLGDNVCIDHANYLSHYILGNEVMISNINEMATTSIAKFGNGVLRKNENEEVRVWMEVRNENGGRSILPFDKMLAGDAWLWSTYRADQALMNKCKEFTEKESDGLRGHYGTVGDRCVIKDCSIIKDAIIGTDAYLKGANKLKNLTINSDEERTSQIGEGCELVNGIIGYGCRIFYGVKAVRFVMAAHSQLKYGARLLNSYLGNNSTISCCEVLNSLIFPGHEQHHNNSFLCASMTMGQSNIAAGATIGSNHNSRAADGEMVAGRGFWPGLCVSLKHNSLFASFTILSKSDFPYELNISIPFCLISNDVTNDRLIVMPGYWFFYNMYALDRNAWKFENRDKRTEKIQRLEYNYLAPDTVNEMFSAIDFLSKINCDAEGNGMATGLENSKRPIVILKVKKSINLFRELINLYAAECLLEHFLKNKFENFDQLKKSLISSVSRKEWHNAGGQLIEKEKINDLISRIKKGNVQSWSDVHQFYKAEGKEYDKSRLKHAYACILEYYQITGRQFTKALFLKILADSVDTKTWMNKGIYQSREKDYTNPFRKMLYENRKEMDEIIGKIEDNQFIQDRLAALEIYKKEIRKVSTKVKKSTEV